MSDLTEFQRNITCFLPNIKLLFNEPLSKHTSFHIGGPVEVMAFPANVFELTRILKVSKLLDIAPRMIGSGTNILAPDEGLRGLTICLKDGFTDLVQLDDTHIRVGAGVSMTKAAVFAASLGLSGLEFAHGIPGSVGGGVYMNAGAYGGEIKDVCIQVDVCDFDGEVKSYTGDEMHFSYRHSRLEEEQGIVTSAIFSLVKKSEDDIRDLMKELAAKRKASQPLDKPSAGSAFKRPVGGYAAALIDNAGLRGFQIGGAAVSKKHTGFVVNLGDASADDVKKLLNHVSDVVFERSGIRLEPEIRIW